MKVLLHHLIALQYLVVQSYCFASKSFKQQAIAEIIVDLFKHSYTVDIITHGDKFGDIGKLIDSVLQHVNDSSVIQVLKCDGDDPWKLQLNTSSVLIFDSPQGFEEIAERIIWQTNPEVRHQHLVSVTGLTFDDLKTLKTDWSKLDSINFLVNENSKSIDLAQNILFSPLACQTGRLYIIDRFNMSTMRWQHSNFYPNKYLNLHGCPLVVAHFTGTGAIAVWRIIVVMAKVRKYNILIREYEANIDNNVPFPYEFMEQFLEEGVAAIPSTPITFASVVFVIPPGEPVDHFEKMFMMFESEVWLAILITLALAASSIHIINCMSQSVKNLVFGSKVTTPTVNMISTFLTGGQNQLPRNSFARFLLMMFIIFSLIIRTCHQSLMFQFLQADLRQPRIQSVEELEEKNFTYLGPAPLNVGDVYIKQVQTKSLS